MAEDRNLVSVGQRDVVPTPRVANARGVLTLVSEEPPEPTDMSGWGGLLQRLCRAARRDLATSGVGISVTSQTGHMLTTAASSPASASLEELQFIIGEGPCLTVFTSHRPVLIPELSVALDTMWPGYGPAARRRGVRAVFAFPLRISAARLGALDLYRNEPGPLSSRALDRAGAYARVATQMILDARDDAGETAVFGVEVKTDVEVDRVRRLQ